LSEFAADIRGHCLEFQEDQYATRFGGSAVEKLDILHLDDSGPSATIIADLTRPNDITSNCFDCIICTHVFHHIYELDKAISELHRILKPDGILLVGVPHISKFEPGTNEIWRFTPEGLHTLLAEVFGANNVIVKAYGNSLTAAGDLRGVVTHEYSQHELTYHDPRFAIEICAHVTKPG
jgi:SAM-dependent methyltransferase